MNELERLCVLNCTDEELAAWFGVTTRTIERRRLEPAFAQVMERGKAKGRISIRRMQMKLLEQATQRWVFGLENSCSARRISFRSKCVASQC